MMHARSVVAVLLVAVVLALTSCSRSSSSSGAPVADAGPQTAVELAPPASGLQLETPTFQVAIGAERQWCYFFKHGVDLVVGSQFERSCA